MTEQQFQELLDQLTHLSDPEKLAYYAMFVAADPENRQKIEQFFLSQKAKLTEIHQNYEQRVTKAQADFQQEAGVSEE